MDVLKLPKSIYFKKHFFKLLWVKMTIFTLMLCALNSNSLAVLKKKTELNVSFRHLQDEKLAEIGEISDLVEDSDGFMWFSGSSGLARYDGEDLKVYLHDKDDEYSLPSNFTMKLHIDKRGALWVGTTDGISLYDSELDRFYSSLIAGEGDEKTGSDAGLFGIAEAINGQSLWLALGTKGLARLDTNTRVIEFVAIPGLQVGTVLDVLQTNDGILWLATMEGLIKVDIGKQTSKVFNEQGKSITSNRISRLFVDAMDRLWVGTMQGLNRYEPDSESFIQYLHQPENPNTIGGNFIRGIEQDSSGRIWIAVDGGGLNVYHESSDSFTVYRTSDDVPSSLQTNNLRGVYLSKDDNLWVYYFPGGISVLNRLALPFIVYSNGNTASSLSNSTVNAVEFSGEDDLWVATEGGLNHIELNKDIVHQYQHNPDDPNSISTNAVISLKHDDNNRLWVGTWEGGLNLFNPSEKTFTRFKNIPSDPESLCNNQIWDIYAADSNTLWLGTQTGLCRFNIDERKFDRVNEEIRNYFEFIWSLSGFSRDKALIGALNRAGFVNPSTNAIVEIPDNAILRKLTSSIVNDTAITSDSTWVATDKGVYRVGKQLQNASRLIFPKPYEDKGITTIIADDFGYLWMGSNVGIFRYHILANEFSLINENHGLPGSRFERDASLILPNGNVVIGGAKGLVVFDPRAVEVDNANTRTVLTALTVLNKDVSIGGEESPIRKAIHKAEEIRLKYNQSMFTLHFTALDYLLPDSYTYSYRLKGFDKSWIHIGKRRLATYTNLDPGQYLFEVRSKNGQGEFSNNHAAIRIVIEPPWWLTWWAYTLYGICLLALLLLILSYIWNKQKAEREKRLNEKLKEVDRLKDEFLANTSHELRTPLHGIIGLSEMLLHDEQNYFSQKSRENLQLIRASSNRLSTLINDILDFSKLRNASIELSFSEIDLHSLVEQVISLTLPLFQDKKLRLENDVPIQFPKIYADKNRLTQILHNLIGNSVKFTEVGSINITASIIDGKALVSVIDTGIGIPEDKLNSIFGHFEQVDGSIERKYGGTGLGLSITKKLVELHGGSVKVESQIGVGTEFYFELALAGVENEDSIEAEAPVLKFAIESQREPSSLTELDWEGFNTETSAPVSTSLKEANREASQTVVASNVSVTKVVIVDDEMVNRRILTDHLINNAYQVEAYENGDALLRAIEDNGIEGIDIILLDVMMPGKSGYETCRVIREIRGPEHLPIIFLTARSEDADIENGYRAGGNDYLAKPFSKDELLHRMRLHLTLLDFNRHLEDRVKRRTAQLESSNLSLKESKEKLMRMQTKLVQSEKMSSLGMLLSGVGHEINNPVNFISMAAHTLNGDVEDFKEYIFELADDAEEEILESFESRFSEINESILSINDGVNRINGVVNNLRTFSRTSSGQVKVQNVIHGLESTINLVNAHYKKHVDITLTIRDDYPIACVLPELNQVFMNLMVNACQAMVSEEKNKKKTLTVTTYKEDVKFCVSFCDSGPGIDKSILSKIFDPFFTTKSDKEGTGLGLSISYEIVRRFDGDINVETKLEQGTTFTLIFPLAEVD